MGSVFQAAGTVKFKDGLRMVVLATRWRLLVPLWQLHLGQDYFQTPLGVQVVPGGNVVVMYGPCQFCRVPCISGIKLQLLWCQIKLAIGYFLYLDLI